MAPNPAPLGTMFAFAQDLRLNWSAGPHRLRPLPVPPVRSRHGFLTDSRPSVSDVRWFRRAQHSQTVRDERPRFPDDILRRLDRPGRDRLAPSGGLKVDTSGIDPFLYLTHPDEKEQESFLRELYAIAEKDHSGFAIVGASKVVWEIFARRGAAVAGRPAADRQSIWFRLARGLPPVMTLNHYELSRLLDLLAARRDSPSQGEPGADDQ